MAAGLWELKGKQAERQTLLSRDDITTKAIKKTAASSVPWKNEASPQGGDRFS